MCELHLEVDLPFQNLNCVFNEQILHGNSSGHLFLFCQFNMEVNLRWFVTTFSYLTTPHDCMFRLVEHVILILERNLSFNLWYYCKYCNVFF